MTGRIPADRMRRTRRLLDALATVPDRQLADEDLRAAGAVAIARSQRPAR